MAWIRGWSIAAKLFALQLVAIVLLAVIAVAWIWADARADVERDAAAKTLAVAQTIAVDPFVDEALATDDPTTELQPYAVEIMDARPAWTSSRSWRPTASATRTPTPTRSDASSSATSTGRSPATPSPRPTRARSGRRCARSYRSRTPAAR